MSRSRVIFVVFIVLIANSGFSQLGAEDQHFDKVVITRFSWEYHGGLDELIISEKGILLRPNWFRKGKTKISSDPEIVDLFLGTDLDFWVRFMNSQEKIGTRKRYSYDVVLWKGEEKESILLMRVYDVREENLESEFGRCMKEINGLFPEEPSKQVFRKYRREYRRFARKEMRKGIEPD